MTERADALGIGLNAVIVAVTGEVPRVLTVEPPKPALPDRSGRTAKWAETPYALPFGPFEPRRHRTLELGLRSWVDEQTGLALGHVEQLYTYADRNRDPRELAGGPRVVSIGYLALVREDAPQEDGKSVWCDWYDFLPWEDWRAGRPPWVDEVIQPLMWRWAESSSDEETRRGRGERVSIAFANNGGAWDPVRALDRYELLYEAGLVAEAERDRLLANSRGRTGGRMGGLPHADRLNAIAATGRPMALDHRRILATGLERLRGKLNYRPVVFELLPEDFTLFRLQRVIEALAGAELHKQNFRRLVTNTRLVEATGGRESGGRGRPAKLYRFRRDVLLERPAPGVGMPAPKQPD